ncbi:hypothetical protein ACTXT7_004317 [Hymenolepis weldensis]
MLDCRSSVIPVSLKVLPTTTLVQVINVGMRLHPSVRDSVKCNHIRARHTLVCRSKRSESVNDKCKEPEKVDLAKPVSFADGTVSTVAAPNAGEAALPYHQDLKFYPADVPWSHIDPMNLLFNPG